MSTRALCEIDRRKFLRGALTVGGLALAMRSMPLSAPLSALASSIPTGPGIESQRQFAPVKVDRNRIIREIVGLRPYRPSGFVVSAEPVGRKLIVHNYGHGGAGVTLSWGTASLALDLARDFVIGTPASSTGPRRKIAKQRSRRFAVLGCGVSGLSTAILLQRRFQDGPGTVTIYAKDLPPETTSNISGAFWYPTSVYDTQQVTAQFTGQYLQACQISQKAFQLLVGADYGVRWIEAFELMQNEASLARELLGGASLYPQVEVHRDPNHYFGFPFARQFTTLMIEPHIYLSALLRDFYVAGGKLVVKEFRSRDEIGRLPEPVIFNCTGLGARELFEDDELIPVRGQLEVLLPQPEIDYCYISGLGYMFPRRDGIILGGTWDHENWSLNPNPEQTNQILAGHIEIMKGLRK